MAREIGNHTEVQGLVRLPFDIEFLASFADDQIAEDVDPDQQEQDGVDDHKGRHRLKEGVELAKDRIKVISGNDPHEIGGLHRIGDVV